MLAGLKNWIKQEPVLATIAFSTGSALLATIITGAVGFAMAWYSGYSQAYWVKQINKGKVIGVSYSNLDVSGTSLVGVDKITVNDVSVRNLILSTVTLQNLGDVNVSTVNVCLYFESISKDFRIISSSFYKNTVFINQVVIYEKDPKSCDFRTIIQGLKINEKITFNFLTNESGVRAVDLIGDENQVVLPPEEQLSPTPLLNIDPIYVIFTLIIVDILTITLLIIVVIALIYISRYNKSIQQKP